MGLLHLSYFSICLLLLLSSHFLSAILELVSLLMTTENLKWAVFYPHHWSCHSAVTGCKVCKVFSILCNYDHSNLLSEHIWSLSSQPLSFSIQNVEDLAMFYLQEFIVQEYRTLYNSTQPIFSLKLNVVYRSSISELVKVISFSTLSSFWLQDYHQEVQVDWVFNEYFWSQVELAFSWWNQQNYHQLRWTLTCQ